MYSKENKYHYITILFGATFETCRVPVAPSSHTYCTIFLKFAISNQFQTSVCFSTRITSLAIHLYALKQANRCMKNRQCIFYELNTYKNEIEQLEINVSAISESCAQLRQPPNTKPHCEKRPLN